MRKISMWGAFAALLGVSAGCYTSAEAERREAVRAEHRADRYAARRDYGRAAAEQQRAEALRRDAADAEYDSRYGRAAVAPTTGQPYVQPSTTYVAPPPPAAPPGYAPPLYP